MKITLIKPTIGRMEQSLYVDEGRMEPLMLGVLAGLTPQEHEVVLYDDRMESIPYDEPTDLVAITVETYTARRAYEIAAAYRERGVRVIMGGMHVMLLPDEVSAHADSILIGDAETVWEQILQDAKENRLQKIYRAAPGIGQMGGAQPRRSIYKGKSYLPISLMQFSRGCQFSCNFCAVSRYFDKKHYIRRIDEVIAEVASQERKFVFFVDDNIASHRQAFKELCRELIPLKINWISQATLDLTHDAEAMALMAQSGCIGNVMGFESITPSSLEDAHKVSNDGALSAYRYEIDALRDHAMQTWAAFTLGYDHDTYDSIMETMVFAKKNRFTFAAFNILMPYPNTPFYEQLKAQNRLLYDGQWWLHPQYRFNHAAFIPKQMTPDELTAACHEARSQFNSISSLLYRFSDLKTNLKSLWRATNYLRYALLFRKEVYKKHSMRFGLKP
jgi:radical SAM superfamily enzyme YgiQ (UPF0313 family)